MSTPGFVAIPRPLYREVVSSYPERRLVLNGRNPLLHVIFSSRLRAVAEQIDASCVKGDVLDLGGGPGLMLPTLESRFRHVTCLDPDITGATRVAAVMGLNNIDLRRGELADLPDSLYDAIVAVDVLEHLRDPSSSVEQIASRLRPGGWLFTSLPTTSAAVDALRKVVGPKAPLQVELTAKAVASALEGVGFHELNRKTLRCAAMLPRWRVSTYRLTR